MCILVTLTLLSPHCTRLHSPPAGSSGSPHLFNSAHHCCPTYLLTLFIFFFFFFLLFSQTFHRAVSLLLFSLHFNAAPGWLLFWRRMFLFLMSSEQTHSSVYFIKSKTKRTISWLRGCSNWHFASLLCLDVLLFHWHRYQLDTALLCLVNIIWMYY